MSMVSSAHTPSWLQLSRHAALAVVAFSALLSLVKPCTRLFRTVFIDYNEGWMAYFSDHAVSGEALYHPLEAFVLNNYPPLSFYLTGIAGAWLGDTIMAGRLLALGGLLVTGMLVGAVIGKHTQSRLLSLCGTFTVVGYMGFYHEDYAGINDPQWMAHAFMMAGFVLFVYKGESRGWLIVSALSLVTAGLIKHSLIAIPLGLTLWLYREDRARFRFWFACVGVMVLAALASMAAIYGPVVFQNILMAPREYHPGSVARAGVWLTPTIVYLAGSLVFCFVNDRQPESRLIRLVLGIAVVSGLIMIGGAGVYNNALYDIVLFGIIVSYAGLGRLDLSMLGAGEEKIRALFLWILIFPVVFVMPFRSYQTREYVRNLSALEQQTRDDIAFVSPYPDPVWSENLALAYWAGKKFSFDFFTTGQKLKTGRMQTSSIDLLLDQRRFSLIQLNDEAGTAHIPQSIRDRIFKNYVVVRKSSVGGIFLVPNAGK